MELVHGRRQRWQCGACSGFALVAPVVLESLGRPAFNDLWQGVRAAHQEDRQCPSCPDRMRRMDFSGVAVDACPDCQLLWFDPSEWQQILERVPGAHDALAPLTEEQMRTVARSRAGLDATEVTGPRGWAERVTRPVRVGDVFLLESLFG